MAGAVVVLHETCSESAASPCPAEPSDRSIRIAISPEARRLGGAGGDVDQVAAHGSASGFGAGEAGQTGAGAQQVVADRRAGQPGRVGGKGA